MPGPSDTEIRKASEEFVAAIYALCGEPPPASCRGAARGPDSQGALPTWDELDAAAEAYARGETG
jgi:hypothetical protein